jgi:hypothetical protein
MTWKEDQIWEADWWGNCTNTLSEEWKQLAYFKRLGLSETANSKWRFAFDLQGKSVLDIGGGPSSFLLRCVNFHVATVSDPLHYPRWIYERYKDAGINSRRVKGENINVDDFDRYDEVWMYNVLQHVEDPEKVVANARQAGKLLRLFDWIDTPPAPGHPHTLSKELLDKWLGAEGTTEFMDEHDAKGMCYYGVFPQ